MNSLSCVILFVLAAMAMGDKPHYDVNDAPALFEKFMKDYNKVYRNEEDKKAHFEAFKSTLNVINKANAASESAVFDINYMADYTPEELKHLTGVIIPKN